MSSFMETLAQQLSTGEDTGGAPSSAGHPITPGAWARLLPWARTPAPAAAQIGPSPTPHLRTPYSWPLQGPPAQCGRGKALALCSMCGDPSWKIPAFTPASVCGRSLQLKSLCCLWSYLESDTEAQATPAHHCLPARPPPPTSTLAAGTQVGGRGKGACVHAQQLPTHRLPTV